jgi:DNA polymerase III sliding clamp (beta) subunit (PCNA family)
MDEGNKMLWELAQAIMATERRDVKITLGTPSTGQVEFRLDVDDNTGTRTRINNMVKHFMYAQIRFADGKSRAQRIIESGGSDLPDDTQ